MQESSNFKMLVSKFSACERLQAAVEAGDFCGVGAVSVQYLRNAATLYGGGFQGIQVFVIRGVVTEIGKEQRTCQVVSLGSIADPRHLRTGLRIQLSHLCQDFFASFHRVSSLEQFLHVCWEDG